MANAPPSKGKGKAKTKGQSVTLNVRTLGNETAKVSCCADESSTTLLRRAVDAFGLPWAHDAYSIIVGELIIAGFSPLFHFPALFECEEADATLLRNGLQVKPGADVRVLYERGKVLGWVQYFDTFGVESSGAWLVCNTEPSGAADWLVAPEHIEMRKSDGEWSKVECDATGQPSLAILDIHKPRAQAARRISEEFFAEVEANERAVQAEEAAFDVRRRTVEWAQQATDYREQRLQELIVAGKPGEICVGSLPPGHAHASWNPELTARAEADEKAAFVRHRRTNGSSIAELRTSLKLFGANS